MDSDRRHEVPETDTKDSLLLTEMATTRASSFVPISQALVPTGDKTRGKNIMFTRAAFMNSDGCSEKEKHCGQMNLRKCTTISPSYISQYTLAY